MNAEEYRQFFLDRLKDVLAWQGLFFSVYRERRPFGMIKMGTLKRFHESYFAQGINPEAVPREEDYSLAAVRYFSHNLQKNQVIGGLQLVFRNGSMTRYGGSLIGNFQQANFPRDRRVAYIQTQSLKVAHNP